jgi:hypothetical protein
MYSFSVFLRSLEALSADIVCYESLFRYDSSSTIFFNPSLDSQALTLYIVCCYLPKGCIIPLKNSTYSNVAPQQYCVLKYLSTILNLCTLRIEHMHQSKLFFISGCLFHYSVYNIVTSCKPAPELYFFIFFCSF